MKWALPEPDTAKALKLRADYRNGIHDLISPDFFPLEAARALTRAERQRRISPASLDLVRGVVKSQRDIFKRRTKTRY